MGRTGFNWLRTGPVVGFCDHGNEPSGSIKKSVYCLESWVTISLPPFRKKEVKNGFRIWLRKSVFGVNKVARDVLDKW